MFGRAFRTVLLPVVLALLVAAALPVAAGESTTRADDAHKVVVKVKYKTDTGKKPLVGVPVYLVYPDGTEVIKCTNDKGIAKFREVPADDGYMLYAGPAFEKPYKKCTNWKFRNPDTNKPMFTVAWGESGNTYGMKPSDTFAVGAGDRNGEALIEILLAKKTPKNPARVCFGLAATWIGTTGDDFFNGTPAFDDVINGRGGDDVLFGQCGDDLICGGPGNDKLYGDEGDDILRGGPGNDGLNGGPGTDTLDGGTGSDDCVNSGYPYYETNC